MTDDHCQKCGTDARWSWDTGMGATGRYCNEHAKEQLPAERKLDSYKDAITTADSLTDAGGKTVVVPGGGVKLIGQHLPVIRSREAFEGYNDDE